MKFQLLIIVLFIALFTEVSSCFAQHEADSLQIFMDSKYQISTRGSYALGSWAILNLGTGIYGAIYEGGKQHYFHQFNAVAGGINLLIAISNYANAKKDHHYKTTILQAEVDQKIKERSYIFNSIVDVFFIGAGAGLTVWGGTEDIHSERLEGYGNALIVQGSFLLAFDGVMYFLHKGNRKKRLEPLLENVSFTGNGLIYRF